MALLTQEQSKTLKIIVPFTLAGYVFYSGYASKGKTDYKASFMMSLIIFIIAYIVVSQSLNFLSA